MHSQPRKLGPLISLRLFRVPTGSSSAGNFLLYMATLQAGNLPWVSARSPEIPGLVFFPASAYDDVCVCVFPEMDSVCSTCSASREVQHIFIYLHIKKEKKAWSFDSAPGRIYRQMGRWVLKCPRTVRVQGQQGSLTSETPVFPRRVLSHIWTTRSPVPGPQNLKDKPLQDRVTPKHTACREQRWARGHHGFSRGDDSAVTLWKRDPNG